MSFLNRSKLRSIQNAIRWPNVGMLWTIITGRRFFDLNGNILVNGKFKIADPYRALEDPDAEVTQKFVAQLNGLSEPFLSACQYRDLLKKKYGLPISL
jgi:hypothetical protein